MDTLATVARRSRAAGAAPYLLVVQRTEYDPPKVEMLVRFQPGRLDTHMRFKLWIETIVHEDEDVRIREAEPSDIPEYFVHATDDPQDILSIQRSGFDLSKFHRTVRKYNTPEFMWRASPKGVYALSGGHEDNERRPWVSFRADINKALVIENKSPVGNAKEALWELYDKPSAAQFRNALMNNGYQAVLRPGSEQIILDPKIITILDVGNVT